MIASIRWELRKNIRRPAFQVAAAAVVGIVAIVYAVDYYQAWHPSAAQAASAGLLRNELYPKELVNNLIGAAFPLGAVVALILGAIGFGTDFGWGTLKTTMTQGPGRLAVLSGRLIAFESCLALLTGTLFATGAAASVVAAIADRQGLAWPSPLELAKGFGAAWLILGSYGAFGVALGIVLRQAAAAVGIGLVYVIVVQGILIQFIASAGDGRYQRFVEFFDGESASALLQSFPSPTLRHATPPPFGPAQAAVTLAAYLVLFLAVSGVLTLRRDVA